MIVSPITYMLAAEREFEDAATGAGFAFWYANAEIRFPRPEVASFIEVWSRRRLLAVNRASNGARFSRRHPYTFNSDVTPNRCCTHEASSHVRSCLDAAGKRYFCWECYSEREDHEASYHTFGDASDLLALCVLLPRAGITHAEVAP